jgi:cbb3-type cytochrome oxidase subunit 3
MFNFMLDDKTLNWLLIGGAILILLIPVIHFALRTLKEKREEEKERKLILRQIMEDREKEKAARGLSMASEKKKVF